MIRGLHLGSDDSAWHREVSVRYDPSTTAFAKQVDAQPW